MFSKHLYTRYYPDPDLLIRTSGEMRISNFLLWQLSYTEMYVTPKLWPDFTRKDLFAAVDDFAKEATPLRRGVICWRTCFLVQDEWSRACGRRCARRDLGSARVSRAGLTVSRKTL